MMSAPIFVQVAPSGDEYATMTTPRRSMRTHIGAVAVLPAALVVTPPLLTRRWKAMPLADDTSIRPCDDFDDSDSRIITPALVQALTFCRLATRAVITPSPVTCRYANVNWSLAPQISAPAP